MTRIESKDEEMRGFNSVDRPYIGLDTFKEGLKVRYIFKSVGELKESVCV